MADASRFRDAATVRIDAPVDRVRELMSRPEILGALDRRLRDEDLEIQIEDDRVEIWAEEDDLHMSFRLSEEGQTTRLAALEDVEPDGLLERTKWMLFPGQAHRDLERELDEFRHVVEAFETRSGG